MDKEFSTEFCKYTFTEDEKKALASEMAQSVSSLQSAEDQKKAIMSDLKGQIDSLQAKVNSSATKLNNGYEMRQIKCEVVADYDAKLWTFIRTDNGEIAKERRMTQDDLQKRLDLG